LRRRRANREAAPEPDPRKDALVATWIEHHRRQAETGKVPDETFWAWEELDQLCRAAPDPAWEIILLILEADQSPATVRNRAAGPLEDPLAGHGPEVIARVEERARNDPGFRLLLGGVWNYVMSADVWARVEKARGSVW
jgi:hypothetical protein